MRKTLPLLLSLLSATACCSAGGEERIDRRAVVERNDPTVTGFDPLASLSVGNGDFAFTVDATGLQSFPELYKDGVHLGTQSQWGWHSFPNTENYRFAETLEDYDFGRGHTEPYTVQFNEPGRRQEAADYFRVNPHRLHLGYVGLEMTGPEGDVVTADKITAVDQTLDMWTGMIHSSFTAAGSSVDVSTVCHPDRDMVAARIASPLIAGNRLAVKFTFGYPTGGHSDDATTWDHPEKHSTVIASRTESSVVLGRQLDTTRYYIRIDWEGQADFVECGPHYFKLVPAGDGFAFSAVFSPSAEEAAGPGFDATAHASAGKWKNYWSDGGFVDFGACTDPRAAELERRVVLSQYLMAIQCAGMYPPQETGLTYNSWYGKFHLEMHWWHNVHFALWNRGLMIEPSLDWYRTVAPVAREIASRQHFDGLRWMKMTDPSGLEAPSKVGSFLIWQQPHYIYMAELLYRQEGSPEILERYADLVFETARFMASFASYEPESDRYVLKGIIPAQETLRASETVNPPFELSYWHLVLGIAQQWKERLGQPREPLWDEIIAKISPLAAKDGLYLAAETASDTYEDVRYTSDHPAVLGALGMLPESRLVDPALMAATLDWIWDNWNWNETWGWDYPMTAMCAARLGDAQKAVDALLMDKRTNTYLINGHNYQDDRLRVYLPGNGGLLTAVGMMCAGWDGSGEKSPGFPNDGNWNVRWEDIRPMP